MLHPESVKCRTIVKTLPGFNSELPFKLETGYVTVGSSELFYYFVESEGKPQLDPVILYINGGPGCSALNGFFYQSGPLAFNLTDYPGGLPQLIYYPYSWTKNASVLFLDSPVGTGFSYSTTAEAVNTSDWEFAIETNGFLRKWFTDRPEFSNLQFFICTDSYAGIILPVISQQILNDNSAGVQPYINLKGYIGSAPHTDLILQQNWKIPYSHRLALTSDRLWELLKANCDGNYVSSTNAECVDALKIYSEGIKLINPSNILYPLCSSLGPRPEEEIRRSLTDHPKRALSSSLSNSFHCKNLFYLLSTVWGNYESVQDALNIRKGTIPEFYRCSLSLANHYEGNIINAIEYHKNLTKSGLHVLLYNGDHDMVIPFQSILDWVTSLGLDVDTDWRSWKVDGQVAGYTIKYIGEGYALTFATIKGAGHSPSEYKRREVYDLFQRWMHNYPV